MIYNIEEGFIRPGMQYNDSIYDNLQYEYGEITNKWKYYEANYMKANTLKKEISVSRTHTEDKDKDQVMTLTANLLCDFSKVSSEKNVKLAPDLFLLLNENIKYIKQAHEKRAYYVLAKSLNGFDLNNNSEEWKKEEPKIDSTVYGFGSTRDEPPNRWDGYYFNHYDDVDVKYNNNPEDAVEIKPFMYSNYTIDRKFKEKDINYVKFWNTNKYDNEATIYKYKAGNMTDGKTQCTFSDYLTSDKVQNYKGILNYNSNDENNKNLDPKIMKAIDLGNGNSLVTMNDRIIAAFPVALFSEYSDVFNDTTDDMNLTKNYNYPPDGAYNARPEVKIQAEDRYKLVDVVIEENGGQQFVVPFTLIDAKSFHLLPNYAGEYTGMFSTFTDNRYGQVTETVIDTKDSYKWYSYDVEGIGPVIASAQQHKLAQESNDSKFKFRNTIYYDRAAGRNLVRVSPIEPYIKLKDNMTKEEKERIAGKLNKIITSVICGKGISTEAPKCKIVSMRAYDVRFADDDGNIDKDGAKNWADRQKEIAENTAKKNAELKISGQEDNISSIIEAYNSEGKIWKKYFKQIVSY